MQLRGCIFGTLWWHAACPCWISRVGQARSTPADLFFDRWGDLVVQLELDVNNLSASSALPRRYLILTFRCFSIFV